MFSQRSERKRLRRALTGRSSLPNRTHRDPSSENPPQGHYAMDMEKEEQGLGPRLKLPEASQLRVQLRPADINDGLTSRANDGVEERFGTIACKHFEFCRGRGHPPAKRHARQYVVRPPCVPLLARLAST